MPCKAVNHSATLLSTGVLSLINGSGVGSVPELLNNLWLNTIRLCGKLKWCNIWHCTNAYGTKDTHNSNIRDANEIV